jgi:hypothetical protein
MYGTVTQGINSSGQIVGEYYSGTISSGIRASGFLFDPASGTYTNFGVPGAEGGTYFQGINAAGSIVGYSVDADRNTRSLLFSSIGTLTRLIEPEAASVVFPSEYATPYRTVAYGINDAGLIAGAYDSTDNSYGFVRGTGTNVGFSGFIATLEMAAVPEPASLALLGVGGIGLFTFRWGS